MLEQQHSFKFRGETVTVRFPNVGQLIDIESLKQLYTGGRYAIMAASNLKSMGYALDLVDSIVFFQVLCPKIKKVAGVDNLINISTELGNELIEVYKKEIYAPWYSDVLKQIYTYGSGEETKQVESEE